MFWPAALPRTVRDFCVRRRGTAILAVFPDGLEAHATEFRPVSLAADLPVTAGQTSFDIPVFGLQRHSTFAMFADCSARHGDISYGDCSGFLLNIARKSADCVD